MAHTIGASRAPTYPTRTARGSDWDLLALADDDLTHVSFPIVKVDRTDDGDLVVWGRATDGEVDADEQVVEQEWAGRALADWLRTGGNVRTMHSPHHLPAGKGLEVDSSRGDGHWVKSVIVEPTAKKLVEKGVLQAYSIGISQPRIIRDTIAKGGRIVSGVIHEISLVDRPSNARCGITIAKSAGYGGTAMHVEELFGEVGAALAKAERKSHRGRALLAQHATTPDQIPIARHLARTAGSPADREIREEWVAQHDPEDWVQKAAGSDAWEVEQFVTRLADAGHGGARAYQVRRPDPQAVQWDQWIQKAASAQRSAELDDWIGALAAGGSPAVRQHMLRKVAA